MRATLWLVVLMWGCEPMPAGDPLSPVRVVEPAPPAPPPPPPEPEVEEEPEDEPEPDDEIDLYTALGLDPPADRPEPPPVDEAPAEPPPAEPRPTEPPPATAPPPVSWGVRLLSTIPDAQPPRAVLGLPDGREEVVTPGTLLPEVGVVVLAVGRDAVQVAEVVPHGDHARVHTQVLSPLYGNAARERR